MSTDAPEQEQGWQSRIVDHGEEDPEQLLANPRNWRIHPKAQQDALAGVLDRVGWVQDVIVNRTTGHIVDGHLRVGLAISREERSVPVAYVELDDQEEAAVLAALDPLSAMAATDDSQLAGLLSDIDDNSLAVMLDALNPPERPVANPTQAQIDAATAKAAGKFDGAGSEEPEGRDVICPACGEEFRLAGMNMDAYEEPSEEPAAS